MYRGTDMLQAHAGKVPGTRSVLNNQPFSRSVANTLGEVDFPRIGDLGVE